MADRNGEGEWDKSKKPKHKKHKKSTKPSKTEENAESKTTHEEVPTEAARSVEQWSQGQEEELLKNVKKYASELTGKEQTSARVQWSKVAQVANFTQLEMQDKYKILTKKVRKIRSVLEITEDAIILHKQRKFVPIKSSRKQPPSAFSLFCKAKRASLCEKHPELKFVEVHKKLCERWKELADEKRQKYVKKAEKAKSIFYEEMKKVYEEQVSKIAKPLSAYDLWKSERLQDEDLDGTETENDLLVEWESLPKSTRKGWLQAAASSREKYESEVENIKGNSVLNSGLKRKRNNDS